MLLYWTWLQPYSLLLGDNKLYIFITTTGWVFCREEDSKVNYKPPNVFSLWTLYTVMGIHFSPAIRFMCFLPNHCIWIVISCTDEFLQRFGFRFFVSMALLESLGSFKSSFKSNSSIVPVLFCCGLQQNW